MIYYRVKKKKRQVAENEHKTVCVRWDTENVREDTGKETRRGESSLGAHSVVGETPLLFEVAFFSLPFYQIICIIVTKKDNAKNPLHCAPNQVWGSLPRTSWTFLTPT